LRRFVYFSLYAVPLAFYLMFLVLHLVGGGFVRVSVPMGSFEVFYFVFVGLVITYALSPGLFFLARSFFRPANYIVIVLFVSFLMTVPISSILSPAPWIREPAMIASNLIGDVFRSSTNLVTQLPLTEDINLEELAEMKPRSYGQIITLLTAIFLTPIVIFSTTVKILAMPIIQGPRTLTLMALITVNILSIITVKNGVSEKGLVVRLARLGSFPSLLALKAANYPLKITGAEAIKYLASNILLYIALLADQSMLWVKPI